MNSKLLGIIIVLAGAIVMAISQMMLKLSSGKTYPNHIREYLNVLVICAYGLSFIVTFTNIIAMRYISVALFAILNGSGQLFVPLFSAIFLKEKLSIRKWIGIAVIIIGIIIVSL